MMLSGRLSDLRRARRVAREISSQRLSALDGRQWDLELDGHIQGRLIPEVASSNPGGRGWLFWHIIWADGTTNYPGTEDYGPAWTTLDEVEAGTFTELVIAEVRPAGLGHEEVCRDQTFALREVPPDAHVPVDLRAQARNRRGTPWHPAL